MEYNTESYQERAIDVPIDCRYHQYFPRTIQECNNKLLFLTKDGENKDDSMNIENTMKFSVQTAQHDDIRRSSTVQDYATTTVHNFEFESLASEPESNTNFSREYSIYTLDDVKQPALKNVLYNQTSMSQKYQVRNTSKDFQCDHSQQAEDTWHRNCLNSIVQKNKEADIHENESTLLKITPEKLHPDHLSKEPFNYAKRSIRKQMNNTMSRKLNSNCTKRSIKEQKNIKFGSGYVDQKIIAYEDNLRRSKFSHDDDLRRIPDVHKYRTIGVPLVGMHNACGLPVITSWHGQDNLRSLRMCRRIVNRAPHKMCGIQRNRSVINKRSGRNNQPFIKTGTITSRNSSMKRKKNSTISALGKNRHVPEKVSQNHQSTTTKTVKCGGALSAKNFDTYSLDVPRNVHNKGSYTGSFGKKSFKKRSSKRKTLYAGHDGEEAVQVLKSLCLNPLARNKSGADMMW